MEEQQAMARYFLHRDMENACIFRNTWVEKQMEMVSIYKLAKEE